MTGDGIGITGSRDARTERYRAAEQAFWQHYDLRPSERWVTAGSPPVRLRVQTVGDGDPVVFVHGTGGAGAYFAPLVLAMGGFRCYLIDRPGWGLSEAVEYTRGSYAGIVVELLDGTLDGLGLERAHVAGASIGNLWATRFAQARPERVDRMVLLGGSPARGLKVPPFIRLLRSPLGRVVISLPEKPGVTRKQMAPLGHAASLRSGRIPDAFIDWHVAMTRDTDWRRNERDMVRAIVDRDGFVPGLVLDDEELAKIDRPTLMVFGTADPTGSVDLWRGFVDALADGELEIVEGGGHLVWLDDPEGVGATVTEFLRR